jgi:hypothetical protein
LGLVFKHYFQQMSVGVSFIGGVKWRAQRKSRPATFIT